MPRTPVIRTQADLEICRGPYVIDAISRINIRDLEATIIGGDVYCYGTCEITAEKRALVHAHDDTRVAVPKRQDRVTVWAHDHVEVDAYAGQVHADGYARVFLYGAAAASADGRSLVIADERSTAAIFGGSPTLRQIGSRATIHYDDFDVDLRVRGEKVL